MTRRISEITEDTLSMSHYQNCPTELDDEILESYHDRGFVVFENALSAEEVEQTKAALSAIVLRSIEEPDTFDVTESAAGAASQGGVVYRSKQNRMFFQLEKGATAHASPGKIEEHIRKYMWFENEAPILKRIYTDHPRIQGVVKSILGENAELYQSMALVKPAKIGIDKPWHQDNAYFSVANLDDVLGTWIALDDSTVENGCMHFIPGGHKSGPLRHHHTYDCEIVEGRINTREAEAIELKAGGIILFHGNIPHYTPPNSSNARRRAIQYHYRNSTNQIVSPKEYFDVFKERDGTPASCTAAKKFGF